MNSALSRLIVRLRVDAGSLSGQQRIDIGSVLDEYKSNSGRYRVDRVEVGSL